MPLVTYHVNLYWNINNTYYWNVANVMNLIYAAHRCFNIDASAIAPPWCRNNELYDAYIQTATPYSRTQCMTYVLLITRVLCRFRKILTLTQKGKTGLNTARFKLQSSIQVALRQRGTQLQVIPSTCIFPSPYSSAIRNLGLTRPRDTITPD